MLPSDRLVYENDEYDHNATDEVYDVTGCRVSLYQRDSLGPRGYMSLLLSPALTNATPSVNVICPTVLGNRPYQVSSQTYANVYVDLRWSFRMQNTASFYNPNYRISVVYDRQTAGTVPSWSTIFAAVYSNGASVVDLAGQPHPYAPKNTLYNDRFCVLYDRQIHLPWIQATGATGFGTVQDVDSAYRGSARVSLEYLTTHLPMTGPVTLGTPTRGGVYVCLSTFGQAASYVWDVLATLCYRPTE